MANFDVLLANPVMGKLDSDDNSPLKLLLLKKRDRSSSENVQKLKFSARINITRALTHALSFSLTLTLTLTLSLSLSLLLSL